MTTKQTITRKITNALLLSALALGTLAPMHTARAMDNSTNKCGVGYVLKSGKCVAIKATGNKTLSKIAHCLANHGQTVDTIKQCMKTH